MKRMPFSASILGAANGVGEVAVAAVDDDVALVEQGQERLDHHVHRLAGLDHDHDAAGRLELGHEFLRSVGAEDGLALGAAREEVVHLGGGAVVDAHRVPVIGHVEHEVFTHHGEADQSDVCLRHKRCVLSVEFAGLSNRGPEGFQAYCAAIGRWTSTLGDASADFARPVSSTARSEKTEV